MGVIIPRLCFGKVHHARCFPKRNAFSYRIYQIAVPLSALDTLPMPYNRFGLLSFYESDHGLCDGSDLLTWARSILNAYHLTQAQGEIILVCMPRVLGYVFNPVSFWLCYDTTQNLRAVLCEVHNTFGERHTYVCAHDDQRPIQAGETLTGEKVFHVSPMLKREGYYRFRFDINEKKMHIDINFYQPDGSKQLVTSIAGQFYPMTKHTLQRAFWHYPLMTGKAITLIHWQALKLLLKGIHYIPKPQQKKQRISTTDPQEQQRPDVKR